MFIIEEWSAKTDILFVCLYLAYVPIAERYEQVADDAYQPDLKNDETSRDDYPCSDRQVAMQVNTSRRLQKTLHFRQSRNHINGIRETARRVYSRHAFQYMP